MSAADRTKKLFADSLIELMRKKELRKITVKDICDKCKINRQTFYYHFRDKYDLVAWIYLQDQFAAIRKAENALSKKKMVLLLEIMNEKNWFYKNAFSDHSQNSLPEYMRKINVDGGCETYKRLFSCETVPENIMFTINFMSYGWTYALIDYIMGNYDIPAEKFAEYMYKNVSSLEMGEPEYTE